MNAIDLHKAIIQVAKHPRINMYLGYDALKSSKKDFVEAWKLIQYEYKYHKISSRVLKRCICILESLRHEDIHYIIDRKIIT